ncbi:MAG: hypothetical protein JXB08_04215 [Bacilli bacterium]|nr:hypothetical protein [Bacilli bacterium]MBN2877135.1 hypothetical protein [Bacilli bacterium]
MNKKDMLARIKQAALEEMPDVRNRIDINQINIEPKPETIRKPLSLRKAFSYTFASIFILATFVIGWNFINLGTDSTPLESDAEIVGFQTVSAAALLDSFSLTALSETTTTDSVLLLSDSTTTEAKYDPVLDEIGLINNYLNMAETVLVEDGQYLYETIESDMSAYAYAFRYNGSDLSGNLITYTGYYNIVEVDGVQTEQGILIHETTQFQYETKTSGTGDQLRYYYQIRVNSENYIEVTNNSTTDSQTFAYKLYQNSQLQNQSEVTLIKQRTNLQAMMQITNQTGDEIGLAVQREVSETQQFRVNYDIMKAGVDTSGEFTVSLEYNSSTQTYGYKYVINGTVVNENRGHKGGRAATDDDFTPGNNSQSPFVTTASVTTEQDTTIPGSGSNSGTRQGNGTPQGNQNSNDIVIQTTASNL